MADYDFGTPGVRPERTFAPRTILRTITGARWLPGGAVIDGSKTRDVTNADDTDVLRSGLLLGKTTSNGKYRNSIIGVIGTAYSASATNITVGAAVATELSRLNGANGTFKLVGGTATSAAPITTTFTHSAINTTTGVVTVGALGTAQIAGSFVMPTDGAEVPRVILDADNGIKATDQSGNSQDTTGARLLVAGFIESVQIINYPTDTGLQAWLKQQLNAPQNGPGAFNFSDNFI